ncbi:MAG: hypothetical protein KatS3mg131_3605 [Candidatus Tectimicrobiota bacterium]|nr:MAG: hypothetical protein KatS3mg131_3605 [Candidatus Tectomicrobia bacterium]
MASPALVEASFWLGNGAVISRVLLYVLPAGWWPPLHDAARLAFAFSGLLGMAAVACLARNLWRTARGEAAASA